MEIKFYFYCSKLVNSGLKWFFYAEQKFPGRSFSAILKKLSIDQLLVIPSMLATFFILNEGFQGNGLHQISLRFRQDYSKVLQTNWSIWPLAQLLNFYFIPLFFRTIFVRCISFFWGIYLSWRSHANLR